MITAQDILNEVEREDLNKFDFLRGYYPDLYKVKETEEEIIQADFNLSKCVRG